MKTKQKQKARLTIAWYGRSATKWKVDSLSWLFWLPKKNKILNIISFFDPSFVHPRNRHCHFVHLWSPEKDRKGWKWMKRIHSYLSSTHCRSCDLTNEIKPIIMKDLKEYQKCIKDIKRRKWTENNQFFKCRWIQNSTIEKFIRLSQRMRKTSDLLIGIIT